MYDIDVLVGILSGGKKMRTLSLVLALVFVAAGVGFAAETATYDVYGKWNMVGLPLVPFNPIPTNAVDGVFDPLEIEFDGGSLQRWDSPLQSMIAYTMFDPDLFGNCLLGDGYWLHQPGVPTILVGQVSYLGLDDGVPDGGGNMTDMWISLPGNQFNGVDTGGWNLISHPYNHDTAFDKVPGSLEGDNILVTDGRTTLTLMEAAAEPYRWLDEPFQYWNGGTNQMETAGYFFATDDHMRAGQGYWVRTRKDNLALIIPAEPS